MLSTTSLVAAMTCNYGKRSAAKWIAVAALLVLVAAVRSLPAQSAETLERGSTVKLLRTSSESLSGRLLRFTSDSVAIELNDGRSRLLPWSSVSRLQVDVGRGHARQGALLGLGLGVALAAYSACCTEYEDPGAGFVFAVGAVVFGGP